MLMNYSWCIQLCTKEADEVVHAYVVNIYYKFGGSDKILSDNGMECNRMVWVHSTITETPDSFCT